MENNNHTELACCQKKQSELVVLQEELETAKSQVVELQQKALYAAAEYENARRRSQKDLEQEVERVKQRTIKQFLAVVDQVELAVTTANNAHVEGAWLEGLLLVQHNLIKLLQELGLQEIDCSDTLNPEMHEAIAQETVQGKGSGQIVTVIQKGYLFGGKVLRYAKVTVAE